ncbi:ATP-binding protein [Motiliproteus sp. MSK22-1]|uniref:ATP-binding protein n=1 Tax=Motiliproteus sp. MSK22-1 TaxID=1897630 RepID=UPI0009773EDF|nr:ATP-binding protein [Motiliproteus sp. MSK22-1]OMH29487.1 hypothetical protein BGP75_19790 [Motiliproteus sp. MSK22-1]
MKIVSSIRNYRKNHPLSARLLAYILLISSALTLFGTGLQVYNDYRNDVSQIHADIQTIEKSFLLPLATGVWNLDREQVTLQLQGALKLRDMIHAEVRENRKGKLHVLVQQGSYEANDSITVTFPLNYESSGFSAQVGELQATFSMKGVYARLQEKVVLILVTQFIKTFIVSFCILIIIHLLITRHLAQLANLASAIDFNDLDNHWQLNRHKRQGARRDELDRLVDSFNRMRNDLRVHLEQRAAAEEKLRDYQEELESVVSERTQALKKNMHQLEQEIKTRIASEQRADKANKAKSEFLANMSHEIRTPMNAVLGFAQILADGETDPEKARHLASISSSGKTLLYLINDILDLSKIEANKLDLELGPVSLPMLFQEIETMFANQVATNGLDFPIQIQPGLPANLLMDENRTRQILINLISNAVKFTSKGQISLQAEYQRTPSDHNQLNLTITVADTGVGIPKNQQQSIFGAFQQRSGQNSALYGGTGLGLTITQRLVRLMGGEISVESIPEQGATFSVWLPNIRALSHRVTLPASDTSLDFERVIFAPGKVLICDDIALNRELLKNFLRPWNLSTQMASNGQEALLAVRRDKPDLILMDMKMPVMDGYAACKALKSDPALKDIPIITVTASAMSDEEEELKEYCDGFLRKPINRAELISECMRFLPNRYRPLTEFTNEADSRVIFSRDALKTPAELFPILLTKLALTRQLIRKMIIQDIEYFAEDMMTLAKNNRNTALLHWSQDLLEASRSFDSQLITRLLEQFIQTIEKTSC